MNFFSDYTLTSWLNREKQSTHKFEVSNFTVDAQPLKLALFTSDRFPSVQLFDIAI